MNTRRSWPAAHLEEARAFNAAKSPMRGPQNIDGLRETRARRAEQQPATDPDAVALTAEAEGRRVPVRVFTPRDAAPNGIYLDIHGGGFYMDSAERSDARNRQLADGLGVAVVSVDYRLAPESPWPAAPDDCETAALWLLDHAAERFGTTRMVIGGASAGATLSMTTLLRLRDRSRSEELCGAALQFGTYDLSGGTPAGRLIADEYFLQAYVGHVDDRTAPDISPVFADLRDLPPTLLVIGDKDILLEDNLAMTARLSAAGNDVDLRIYPESPHAFTSHPTALAATARHDIESWIAERIANQERAT
ncbi:UNVERIFIED_CONTAM: acetyl esterase/lipase [Williamsia faeni]